MFDQINKHQQKLFNLSKIILIVVALVMSFIVIHFVFFYKKFETRNNASSEVRIESADLTIEP